MALPHTSHFSIWKDMCLLCMIPSSANSGTGVDTLSITHGPVGIRDSLTVQLPCVDSLLDSPVLHLPGTADLKQVG